jgi:protein phosphatase PTC1
MNGDTEEDGSVANTNITNSGSSPSEQPPTPSSTSTPNTTTATAAVHGAPDGARKFTSVTSVGISHDRNARFRRSMEDEHVIVDTFGGDPDQGYFAIYDGHGGRGAVDFTAKTLHKNLLEQLQKDTDPLEALRQSYLLTDKQMGESQIQFSGTTCISSLIRKKGDERWLFTANAGDARAVLCRNGKAVRLSYDHKGSDEGETKRIVDAGGFVVLNRVNGILAVTRSLGDHAMKDYVIGEPHLNATLLEPTDTHLILACDGLWDVASDQEAIDLILSETDAQKMSDKLLLHALKNGSTDNISVMVIIL